MGRFYGIVGYAETTEKMTDDNPPKHTGIFVDTITERMYFGDVSTNNSKWQTADKVNDNLEVTVTISIVADAYAYQNYSRIKYVVFEGVKWKVQTITPSRPRITLYLGGEYNGSED